MENESGEETVNDHEEDCGGDAVSDHVWQSDKKNQNISRVAQYH